MSLYIKGLARLDMEVANAEVLIEFERLLTLYPPKPRGKGKGKVKGKGKENLNFMKNYFLLSLYGG